MKVEQNSKSLNKLFKPIIYQYFMHKILYEKEFVNELRLGHGDPLSYSNFRTLMQSLTDSAPCFETWFRDGRSASYNGHFSPASDKDLVSVWNHNGVTVVYDMHQEVSDEEVDEKNRLKTSGWEHIKKLWSLKGKDIESWGRIRVILDGENDLVGKVESVIAEKIKRLEDKYPNVPEVKCGNAYQDVYAHQT